MLLFLLAVFAQIYMKSLIVSVMYIQSFGLIPVSYLLLVDMLGDSEDEDEENEGENKEEGEQEQEDGGRKKKKKVVTK